MGGYEKVGGLCLGCMCGTTVKEWRGAFVVVIKQQCRVATTNNRLHQLDCNGHERRCAMQCGWCFACVLPGLGLYQQHRRCAGGWSAQAICAHYSCGVQHAGQSVSFSDGRIHVTTGVETHNP